MKCFVKKHINNIKCKLIAHKTLQNYNKHAPTYKICLFFILMSVLLYVLMTPPFVKLIDRHLILRLNLRPHSKLIRKIHQTYYKRTPNMESWTHQNPYYETIFYNDSDARAFVARKFPEHIRLYDAFNVIRKADFFRYLVLYAEGGVYADVDVDCSIPVDYWLPSNVNLTGKLVVGFEGDTKTESGRKLHKFTHILQYCQWTMAVHAKKHDILKDLINRIAMAHPAPTYKYTGLLGPSDVLYTTGPGVWTSAIDTYLLNQGVSSRIVMDHIMKQKLSIDRYFIAGDLVVLPASAFSCCAGRLSSPPEEETRKHPDIRVTHEFFGSWKPGAKLIDGIRKENNDIKKKSKFQKLLVYIRRFFKGKKESKKESKNASKKESKKEIKKEIKKGLKKV